MANRMFIVLVLRLIVLFLLFQSLSSIGAAVYALAIPDSHTSDFVGFQLSMSLAYFVALLILFKYASPIAEKVSKGISEDVIHTRWSSVELLTIVLAGVAAYIILSSVPIVVNQVFGIAGYYSWNRSFDYIPKGRLNDLFIGLLGTFIKIGVATIVFVKAKRVATLWEHWQSTGRLTSGSS
jgi:hypothetical protein